MTGVTVDDFPVTLLITYCKTPRTCTGRRKSFQRDMHLEKPFSGYENTKTFLAVGACPECFAIRFMRYHLRGTLQLPNKLEYMEIATCF